MIERTASPAMDIRDVANAHQPIEWGRWLLWAIVLVVAADFAWIVANNKNFGWPIVAKWLTADSILKGLSVTLGLTAILFFGAEPARAHHPPPCPCPPAPTEPPVWTGSAGLGLSLNRGNTDTTNVNLSFEVTRDPKQKDIWKLQALYMRGDTNGDATADRFIR